MGANLNLQRVNGHWPNVKRVLTFPLELRCFKQNSPEFQHFPLYSMDLLGDEDQQQAGEASSGDEHHNFDSDTVNATGMAATEIIDNPTASSPTPAADQPAETINQPSSDATSQLPDGPPELWVETKTDSGKSYFYHSTTRETTWTRPEGRNVKVLSQAELEQVNAAKQMTPVVPAVAMDPVLVETRPPPVLFGAPPPRFAMPPPLGMPPPGFGAPSWMFPPAAGAQVPPPSNLLVDPMLVAKASEWTEHKAPDGRT